MRSGVSTNVRHNTALREGPRLVGDETAEKEGRIGPGVVHEAEVQDQLWMMERTEAVTG